MRALDSQPTALTHDDAPSAAAGNPIAASAAQRQRMYRLRRKRAAIDAIGEEASASRVTLLSMLGHDLSALEARTTPATMTPAIRSSAKRSSAKRILNVIVTRYAIEL
jgi:DICT domain-containing protein